MNWSRFQNGNYYISHLQADINISELTRASHCPSRKFIWASGISFFGHCDVISMSSGSSEINGLSTV